MSLQNKTGLIRAVVVIVASVSFGAAIPHFLTFSPTSSLPYHFFVLNRAVDVRSLKPGMIVRFPHCDRFTGGKREYLLKRIGCIAGQTLTVSAAKDYFCDGRYLGRAKDRALTGEPVKNFVWGGVVPPGKFFAVGDNVNSYDSRYFGFVDRDAVVGRAYPIF